MSSPTGPASGLPVRTPRPRQTGRHRRPEPAAAPAGAPPLVLVVPGTPDADARRLAEEILSIARSELPGLDGRIAYAEGDDEEFPQLGTVLKQAGTEREDRVRRAEAATQAAAEELRAVAEAEGVDPAEIPFDDSQVRAAAEGPGAVVVPLLAGPDTELQQRIAQAADGSGTTVETTDVLGPHPLLAEALHVKLSEAGLARADRARLFTVATAADGIVLATSGGPEAAKAAGITGMLLSARLAVPVLAAALDEPGEVVRVAEQLRSSGSTRLALAPYLIGPEMAPDAPAAAAEEAGCAAAEPLGAYPAVGKLVLSRYAAALGVSLTAS
ncbi:hypothetical protein [Streptomyces palmae]|uniref:Sirohydrochlorin ferrochelatase n=1 Tax=Streptomyces palmae TaxID=1701085 RepID=A0A4Z0HD64_9ACTN|nr:hypothetical protein [Streptomyces palmae]TGB18265.1 hypothetical protein E4099_02120 [Streptomyces palmae]